MGQRSRILAQIFGFDGFKVSSYFEAKGTRVADETPPSLLRGTALVVVVTRRWLPRCGECGTPQRQIHQRLEPRRWQDIGILAGPSIR
jgi:hypothetical protein